MAVWFSDSSAAADGFTEEFIFLARCLTRFSRNAFEDLLGSHSKLWSSDLQLPVDSSMESIIWWIPIERASRRMWLKRTLPWRISAFGSKVSEPIETMRNKINSERNYLTGWVISLKNTFCSPEDVICCSWLKSMSVSPFRCRSSSAMEVSATVWCELVSAISIGDETLGFVVLTLRDLSLRRW